MKINGREYEAPKMNFATLCKLEESGVAIDDIGNRPLTLLCAFVALAMGSAISNAQDELDAHMAAGGSLDEISSALDQAVRESGFFRSEAARLPA